MHPFDVLGDPIRRRILELIAGREQASGEIVAVVSKEFGVTQPAVSQHLKVLREAGFANVTVAGTRRLYALNADPLVEIDRWLAMFRPFWSPKLDALTTEIARGKRQRQRSG